MNPIQKESDLIEKWGVIHPIYNTDNHFFAEPVFRGLHHECLEAILRKS